DVFRTSLLNNFVGEIVHLGTGINSSRDDYGFVFDAKSGRGYLTSNRPEGRGNEDIWQVRKRVDEFVITVTDPQRNPVPGAEIDFSACNAGSKTTDASGKYSFAVASGKADCRVTVRKPGYQSTVVPIQSNGDKSLEAVLIPEYGTVAAPNNPVQPNAYNSYDNNNWSPATYNTTDYPVDNVPMDRFNVYVSDGAGRALPAAEVNLNACGLGTLYTDMYGKASFYFPRGANCNMVVRKNGLEDVVILLNDRTSRELSVAMSTEQRTKYVGLVLSADTRRPLHDVVITARSRQGNHETLAYTNFNGQYTLLLRSYQTYDISYVKTGYLNFTSSLQTERPLAADMELSPITLVPGQSYGNTTMLAPATYNTNTAPGSGMISLADLEDLAKNSNVTPFQPSPDPVIPTNTGNTSRPVNAFAIQLSANPNGYSAEQTRKYDALTGAGNIYSVKDGNLHKLRLGVYPTREAAADVLKNTVQPVVKDAFIVNEDQADASMLVGPSMAGNSTSLAAKGGALRYAVQVASWPNSSTILVSDYANLAQLGYVYIQQESDRLRVRVGTWGAYDQAETARAQAIQLGYRDALIVSEKPEDLTHEKLLAPPAAKGNMTTSPAQYSSATTVAPVVAGADNAKYYVRVCALDDPYNFDIRKVDGTGGIVEKWPIGSTNKTAIMLTGFPSVGQAMLATDKLRSSGFQDAYIIKDENGRMSKYRY
ncbi:MAG: carboxypeptidase regulatory-like domain-containing protein, partial [Saprospiraceae bacterium]|nr:carboxypeptidase regulatory-like domain-containing protein [Saprospiraceae bacterium]